MSTAAPVSAFASSNPSPFGPNANTSGGALSSAASLCVWAFSASAISFQSYHHHHHHHHHLSSAMSSHPSVSMSSAPDFSVKSSSLYKPEKSPYDLLLPKNYLRWCLRRRRRRSRRSNSSGARFRIGYPRWSYGDVDFAYVILVLNCICSPVLAMK